MLYPYKKNAMVSRIIPVRSPSRVTRFNQVQTIPPLSLFRRKTTKYSLIINHIMLYVIIPYSDNKKAGRIKPIMPDRSRCTAMDDLNSRKEINKYRKFKKVDGATYHKVNQFLRKRTYITAREWALARLCTDFRTSGGAEMTFIGMHLPELVPFMEDTYTPQAVNQARNAFKKKVRKSSATFFYGAMCGFFTTDELDDLLFEASEVARFLLEVEGTTLDIDEEIDIEDRITRVMRGVGEAAKTLLKNRSDEVSLPDQKESTDPPAKVSAGKDSSQDFADPAGETVSPDNETAPPIPAPEQQGALSSKTAGSVTEAEIPEFSPLSVGNTGDSDTGEIQGNDEPPHISEDKNHTNADAGSILPEKNRQEKEDS